MENVCLSTVLMEYAGFFFLLYWDDKKEGDGHQLVHLFYTYFMCKLYQKSWYKILGSYMPFIFQAYTQPSKEVELDAL